MAQEIMRDLKRSKNTNFNKEIGEWTRAHANYEAVEQSANFVLQAKRFGALQTATEKLFKCFDKSSMRTDSWDISQQREEIAKQEMRAQAKVEEKIEQQKQLVEQQLQTREKLTSRQKVKEVSSLPGFAILKSKSSAPLSLKRKLIDLTLDDDDDDNEKPDEKADSSHEQINSEDDSTRNNSGPSTSSSDNSLSRSKKKLKPMRAGAVASAEEIGAAGYKFDKVELFDRGDKLGRGVRATKDIAKDETFASYGGEKVLQSEFKAKNPIISYAIHLNNDYVLDGDPTLPQSAGHLGQFCNDASGTFRQAKGNNARFNNRGSIELKGERIRTVFIVANRPIRAGEEIFVRYGSAYWRGQ